jgi:hypothetical protein
LSLSGVLPRHPYAGDAFFHAGFTLRATVLSRDGLNLLTCFDAKRIHRLSACVHRQMHPAARLLRKQSSIPHAAVTNVIPVAAFIAGSASQKVAPDEQ